LMNQSPGCSLLLSFHCPNHVIKNYVVYCLQGAG
jgi:hypothetical protein